MSLQAGIQRLLDEAVCAGRETGIQVAVYHQGQRVVDAWAGVANRETGQPVSGDTLFPVFSTTKGIAATIAHRLAERGCFAYDDPICKYWPEFARHGKDGVTIRHALCHATGVPHVAADLTLDDLYDWARACAATADLKLLYPPGTKIEYHPVSFSWILCEVLCRVARRTFPQLVDEEIRAPLGLRDLYVGLPDELSGRVAVLYMPHPDRFQANAEGICTIPACMQPLHEWMNSPAAQCACLPSSNGIMSARAIAEHYAALLPGGSLLKPGSLAEVTRLQNPMGLPEDQLAGRFALGYQLGGGESPFGQRASAFGHGGYGGSIGFADPDAQFAMGLTKNLYSKSSAHGEIILAVRQGLGLA